MKTCLFDTFFFVGKFIMSKNQKLKIINKVNNNTLMEHLNIEFIDVGNDYLTAKMPVSSKVHQPDGVLHGGATVALAESVGSAASFLFINPLNQTIRGLTPSGCRRLHGLCRPDPAVGSGFLHDSAGVKRATRH